MNKTLEDFGTRIDEKRIIGRFLAKQVETNNQDIEKLKTLFEEAVRYDVEAFLKKRKRFATYLHQRVSQFSSIPNPTNLKVRKETLFDLFRKVVGHGVAHGQAFFSFPQKNLNRKDFWDFMEMLKGLGLRYEAPIGHKNQLVYFDMEFKYAEGESQEDYSLYRFFFR